MTKLSKTLLMFFVFIGCGIFAFSVEKSENVTVDILPEYSSIDSNIQYFWIGIHFQMDPDWYIYWKNPGDSGGPPTIQWESSTISVEDELIFPIPQQYYLEPLLNYVYKGNVLLLAKAKFKKGLGNGKKTTSIIANIRWLECNDVCISAQDTIQKQISWQPSQKSSIFQKKFVEQKHLFAKEDIGLKTPNTNVDCHEPVFDSKYLQISCNTTMANLQDKKFYFYIEQKDVVEYVPNQNQKVYSGGFSLSIPRELEYPKEVSHIGGYMVIGGLQSNPIILKYNQKIEAVSNSQRNFVIFAVLFTLLVFAVIKFSYKSNKSSRNEPLN